jgi:hypothetical protein
MKRRVYFLKSASFVIGLFGIIVNPWKEDAKWKKKA